MYWLISFIVNVLKWYVYATWYSYQIITQKGRLLNYVIYSGSGLGAQFQWWWNSSPGIGTILGSAVNGTGGNRGGSASPKLNWGARSDI